MTVWIIIGWIVLFALCFFVASALHDLSRSSRSARRQLHEQGFASEGSLAKDQPVFFRATPRCQADALIEAAFSQIPALYFHTRIDAYHGRKKQTVVDRTETAAFQIVLGDQIIEAPPADAPITWLTARIHAYQGLAGKMTQDEQQRLIQLGVGSNAPGANPMRAISVEEDVLPMSDELWIYGKIGARESSDDANSPNPPETSVLVLQSPSETMQAIIATSAKALAQQLRYQQIINLSAALFIFAAPFFFLAVSLIR